MKATITFDETEIHNLLRQKVLAMGSVNKVTGITSKTDSDGVLVGIEISVELKEKP